MANRISEETSLTSTDDGADSADTNPAGSRSADAAAAWETEARETGHLPPVRDPWARDPDYLVARLRDVLGGAHGRAELERRDPVTSAFGDSVELALLQQGISDLIRELRPYGRAGTETLAVLEALAPSMAWKRVAGSFLGASPWGMALETVADTAARLRLRPGRTHIDDRTTYRQWIGRHEGWVVRLGHLAFESPMHHSPTPHPVSHESMSHASGGEA